MRSPDLLRLKIESLNLPVPSAWDEYHSEYMGRDELTSTPRFDRILEIIRSLESRSVTELAGNQGLLSLLIAAKINVERIICTDSSEGAVNRFYNHCRSHPDQLRGRPIQAGVLNFMLPETASRLALPSKRFQSDTVLALAVTHHLLLTQNFHIRDVLASMAAYTRQYALIEFMPLGLWDGKRAPSIPGWYTQAWFEEAFRDFFEILLVEKLEANRIIYVGRLKADCANSL